MWPYPKIVAHRGGGALAPENTLAALRCGLALGFRAVEFDVMLSRDGVPVLMHDPDLGRTLQGQGRLADYDAQELLAMDAGSWFAREFAGEPVPSLAQVITFCQGNGIWMNIEIKPVPGYETGTGDAVAALTRRRFLREIAGMGAKGLALPDPSLPLFSSFSDEALMAAKRAAPEIPRALLLDMIPPDWQLRMQAVEAIALHTNQQHLTPLLAREVKQAGYGLFCYTVNDVARATEIMAWGVDGFCTDRIDLISAQFA